MLVDVAGIRKEIQELNILLDEYENIYLNLYNEMLYASSFWVDSKAELFFKDAKIDKLKIMKTLEELKSAKSIYEYIVNTYGELGEKVAFNLNARNIIIDDFNYYIGRLNTVINIYISLDFHLIPNYSYVFYRDKKKMISNRDLMATLRDRIIHSFDKIKEIEDTVNGKISKFQIEFMSRDNFDIYL